MNDNLKQAIENLKHSIDLRLMELEPIPFGEMVKDPSVFSVFQKLSELKNALDEIKFQKMFSVKLYDGNVKDLPYPTQEMLDTFCEPSTPTHSGQIRAIKMYREKFGALLAEAKTALEQAVANR